ncbi:hypothetical protein QBC46DRAFT_367939 [Diplogelasinospora grovesii]|uniref:Uncharacterized protein n=1 Tax=Diplogelasinospora grovesii TaxID=303347 RepID=A0AAN6MWP7_9PEZI|nr:hypothetical protein QBC46DRAFT_367939 [Diplogelasinospora grovesii]
MADQDTRRRFEDVAHQSSPLAAGGSTAPAFASGPTIEYECVQKRDELLEENDRLVLRLAAFEHVMSVECLTYRERKERTRPRLSRPRIAQEDGAAKWDRFVGVAAVGSDTIPELPPPSRAISLQWGKDFVQHYQLAGKGQYYCNQFSAAIKPHTRENGVRQLNQLLLRRFRIPGQRDVRVGVNPVEPVALRNLASWRDEGPFFKEGDPDKVQLQPSSWFRFRPIRAHGPVSTWAFGGTQLATFGFG